MSLASTISRSAMNWLYLPIALLVLAALILIFARDWVWSIDSRDAAFQRDENGVPMRTPAWDRNHLLAGIMMLIVAVVLGVVVYMQ